MSKQKTTAIITRIGMNSGSKWSNPPFTAGWTASRHTRNINLPMNQKGYVRQIRDLFRKLSARRIQIYLIHFVRSIFTSIFKIISQIISEQKCTKQNRVCLVEYSAVVSRPSDVPQFVEKLILNSFRGASWRACA